MSPLLIPELLKYLYKTISWQRECSVSGFKIWKNSKMSIVKFISKKYMGKLWILKMKYLIFSVSLSDDETKYNVEFRHSTRIVSRIRRKLGTDVS